MTGMFDDQPSDTIWAVPLGWQSSNEAHCRSCGAEILWCITPAGKKAPINRDGTSHFANCPDADRWRRRA
jgi:hypothetical protein